MNKVTLFRQLGHLLSLYTQLPSVHCIGCGACCVSPTCTLLECAFLLNYCKKTLTKEMLSRLLLKPCSTHPLYEGNTVCFFLHNNRCIIHPGRPGACRLFGQSAVDNMDIMGMVTCKKIITPNKSGFTQDNVQDWLQSLTELNEPFYSPGEAPYFIIGLNVECWIDILMYDSWEQPFFQNLHDILNRYYSPPQIIVSKYQQRTDIVRKVAAIDHFFENIDNGDTFNLQQELLQIRDGFLYTGTWFYKEANRFLEKIENSFALVK